MDGDQDGFEFSIGQHHAHWQLICRFVQVLCRQSLQHFGVSRKLHARQCQRLFVQWRRDDRRHLAAQSRLGCPCDAVSGKLAGNCTDFSESGKLLLCKRASNLLDRKSFLHRHWLRQWPCLCSDHLPRPLHNSFIAHHDAIEKLLRRLAKSLDDDLWANARRVTDSDGDGLLIDGHCQASAST